MKSSLIRHWHKAMYRLEAGRAITALRNQRGPGGSGWGGTNVSSSTQQVGRNMAIRVEHIEAAQAVPGVFPGPDNMND